MKHLILHFVAFFILLKITSVNAQVVTNLNNTNYVTPNGKFLKPYIFQADYIIQGKNISALLKEEQVDALNSKGEKPFQLAVPVKVDLSISKLINWQYDGGFAYGKYTIKLDSALSSSINFDSFYLPKMTEMYIYNENGNMITGPVTDNKITSQMFGEVGFTKAVTLLSK